MPRAGLTHQRVVAEAARVADEAGLDRLTLAAVAKRMGVTLPGLYKHIDSLDSLKRDLAVLGVRELTAAISAAGVGRSGRDALHAMARAYRGYAAAHPGLSAASVRAPEPTDSEHLAAGEAAVAVLLAVLDSYHLDGSDAIDAIRVLRVAMHGFTTLEAAGGFGLPQSVDATFTRLVDALDATFTSWSVPQRHDALDT
jgi:AcrR family transcriptional regulator